MIKDFNKIAIIAGEREVNYTEMKQRIALFANMTPVETRKNLKPGEAVKTIIFSENREGWAYAFFSIWQNNGIAVPVDASSTVHDLAYIINDCKPASIWTSLSKVSTVREAIEETGHSANINIIDDFETASIAGHSLDITKQEDGSLNFDSATDSTALLIYTSGTTGSPKGVMLSYDNLFANQHGVVEEVNIFNSERRTLVLLPLHHVLPLMGCLIIPILQGGGIAICPSMTGPDIMDTLCRGKVAIFIGVPRLWQTLYAGIKKKIDASPVTRALFAMCAKANNRALSRMVFQSVRKKMGGHIDYCVSGGAALDKEIGNGLKTLGLDVLEGYGMTETAPIIAFTRPGDIIPGCVGLPLPSVECKLIDGELCARGKNVMQGYYNRPEETAAVIDKDGYIHTGDLARFDEKGRVYITGRTKEIIVLSNGKNVQPNEIEFKLEKYDDKVKEAAVVQDGDMLRAIIVPQPQWVAGRTDSELEVALKREVVEPYNLTVTNYKKIMSIFVYHNDLPRTRMDKLQRFKLNAIINNANSQDDSPAKADFSAIPDTCREEFTILKKYIEAEKKLPVQPLSHIETDLAFDSLDKVGLQGFIEQNFGMQLNADSMAEFPNILNIAEHISKAKTKMETDDTDWHTMLTDDSSANGNKLLQLPSTSTSYPLLARMFKGSFNIYNSLTIKGKENIPAKGPFILAANHQSFLDGPLTMTGMPWSQISDCYFYATEEHVQHPVLKYMARHNNIILMERKNLKNSIIKLAEVLKQGKNVVIFPEGSRTHSGEIGQFKKMFAILSIELQVPILPVCISGAFEALPRHKRIGNTHHIDVEYLPIIQPHGDYDTMATDVRTAINNKLTEYRKGN